MFAIVSLEYGVCIHGACRRYPLFDVSWRALVYQRQSTWYSIYSIDVWLSQEQRPDLHLIHTRPHALSSLPSSHLDFQKWSANQLPTNIPETATHAIDFGPGALSGIGPLAARNFEGRGVRVIVLGEKDEGGPELYDVKNAKYEDWRTKKWAPKLVKTRCVLVLAF